MVDLQGIPLSLQPRFVEIRLSKLDRQSVFCGDRDRVLKALEQQWIVAALKPGSLRTKNAIFTISAMPLTKNCFCWLVVGFRMDSHIYASLLSLYYEL